MTCSRCYGLVVEDRFKDWTARWRCMECGHVQDLVNEENHLARKEKCLVRKSDEPDYQDEEVHIGLESFIGPDAMGRRETRVKWRTAAK